ncbi:hypothetical protein ES703_54428 [subsurface metagenome]
MGIAILALALLLMMKKNGVTVPPAGVSRITERIYYPTPGVETIQYVPVGVPRISGVGYRTRDLARMAVEFEDRLEENKEDIKTWEREHPTAIPVMTRAISYRAFLQEKPVKVTTGVYEIR